jgi:hypothetical protein
MLPFLSVYYSYAILYQNEKKENGISIPRLMIIVLVFSLITAILEIISSRPPIGGVLPLLIFGLCVFIFKKFRLSLRGVSWSLFLSMFPVLLYLIITSAPFI